MTTSNLLEKEKNSFSPKIVLEVKDIQNETQNEEAPEVTFASFQLPSFLQQGLTRAGFEHPTSIQAQAIPILMAGRDLVAQSQTGSGKTAAFALPLIARIQRQSRDLQALIMVPTRELALQVTQVFKTLAGPAVRITPIYGGAGMEGQVRGLRQGGYQIVVGTPGRLRDHLRRGTLQLGRLRMLVLDEADEMLDQGFAPDVEALIEAAPPAAKRQTALFSATLPQWVAQTAAKHLRPDHGSIVLEAGPAGRPNIEQVVYDMKLADKTFALRHLLDNEANSSVLVFARTKHGVKKLAARLEEEGYAAAGLQGNLSQKAREEVMADFRSKRIRIMVATNVGARGLDVSGIGHVINFDLPESAELFTHRVGRTGRNGASGTAITFLTGEDRAKWREIERFMAQEGIEVRRSHWSGPRAEPGAEPAFTQPTQRGRFSGSSSSFSDRDRGFESRPAPRRESNNFDRPAPRRDAGEFDRSAPRRDNSSFDRSAPRRDSNDFDRSAPRRDNPGFDRSANNDGNRRQAEAPTEGRQPAAQSDQRRNFNGGPSSRPRRPAPDGNGRSFEGDESRPVHSNSRPFDGNSGGNDGRPARNNNSRRPRYGR